MGLDMEMHFNEHYGEVRDQFFEGCLSVFVFVSVCGDSQRSFLLSQNVILSECIFN